MDACEQSHAFVGSALLFPYRIFLAIYQEHGLIGSTQDIAILTRLLGRSPRSHASLARENAMAWRKR
jgi:hypothetical protein